MSIYHYVYKITNLNPIDERKYYIGVRTSKVLPFEDKYMSSSKTLNVEIKKYGAENYKKEILTEWESRKLAVAEEIRLHNLYNVNKNPEFYNKAKQTSVGFDTGGITGEANHFFNKHHTIQQREKWCRDRKGTRLGDENTFFGKKHTEEAKKKIAEGGWEGEKGELRRKRIGDAQKISNHKIKSIAVYNAIGELQHIVKTGFISFCEENKLPRGLASSYRRGGVPLYLKKDGTPIKKGIPLEHRKYTGWYAIVIKSEEDNASP